MNMTIKNLRKLSKNQLVYTVYQLENTHKQAVTDHAMEVSRLNAVIQAERKTVDFWRTEFNNAVDKTNLAKRDLKEAHNQITNQRQVIRKLGNSIADLGECIAHL